MTYQDLLQRPEWKSRREEILKTNNYECQKCKYPHITSIFEDDVFFFDNTDIDILKFERVFGKGLLETFSNSDEIERICVTYLKSSKQISLQIDVKEFIYSSFGGIGHRINSTILEIPINNIIIRNLHIHHKSYIRGRMPWDYEDANLITLYEDCHGRMHQETQIPIYSENNTFLENLETCPRCGGSGYIEQFHYVQNGICFQCHGEGVII